MNAGPAIGSFVLRTMRWVVYVGLALIASGLVLHTRWLFWVGVWTLAAPYLVLALLGLVATFADLLDEYRWNRRK